MINQNIDINTIIIVIGCIIGIFFSAETDSSRVIGWGNLYVVNNNSIVEINGFQSKVGESDSLTIVSPDYSQGVKNIKLRGDIDKSDIYGTTTWVSRDAQSICTSCDYNKSIERGEAVYVVYPKVDTVHYISDTDRGLPEKFRKQNVEVALDVSGDKREDILVVRYCRNEPAVHPDSTSVGECEAARKAYRFTDGEYKLTYESPTPPPVDH